MVVELTLRFAPRAGQVQLPEMLVVPVIQEPVVGALVGPCLAPIRFPVGVLCTLLLAVAVVVVAVTRQIPVVLVAPVVQEHLQLITADL